MKTLSQLINEMDRKEKNTYNQQMKRASKGGISLDMKLDKDMTQKKRDKLGLSTDVKHLETMPVKKLNGKMDFGKKEIKEQTLDEALNFDASFPDVWSALEHVNSIAEQYGVSLPEIEELDNDEFGEEVFQVEEDAYLYFCYALNEQGEYDIVSGVFNSSELDELLSEEE